MAGGRKPKYDYEDAMFLLEVEGYARDGFDDKQIAKLLNLEESYFCTQKKKFPKLSQALKKGRRPLTVMVENSLFKRAMGMKVTTIVKKYMELEDGTVTEEAIIQKTETELPPDTGAAMAWLRNKKAETWNKAPIKVANTDPSGDKQAPLLFLSADQFTEDQIQAYIKQNINPDQDEASDNDQGL